MKVVKIIFTLLACAIIVLGVYSAAHFFLSQVSPAEEPPDSTLQDGGSDGQEADEPDEPDTPDEPDEPDESESEDDSERSALYEQAEQVMANMTMEQKIYQMIFTTPEAVTDVGQVTRAGDATKAALESYPVGGMIYTGLNFEGADPAREMLDNTKNFMSEAGNAAPFLAVYDAGGNDSPVAAGLDGQDVSSFAGAAQDGTDAIGTLGGDLAGALSAYGFNVNLASGVQLSENALDILPDSFGSDPQTAADGVRAYLDGMQKQDVFAMLAGFPAEASAEDGVCGKSREELDAQDLSVYKAAIDAGAELVLVSGTTASGIDDTPACLSQPVMTDLLRNEFSFEGVILADVFTQEEYGADEAVAMAIKAGADMIYGAYSPEQTYNAILAGVNRGDYSQQRIDESVRRILAVKLLMGVIEP